jgi:hypothetical protein
MGPYHGGGVAGVAERNACIAEKILESKFLPENE